MVFKVICIYVMAMLLSANTFVGELLQLPVLIHHYSEHAEQDGMPFFKFLSIHYSSEINHPDDQHNDHNNLPFKSVHSPNSNITTTVPSLFDYSETISIGIVTKVFPCYKKHHSSLFVNDIWQPPCIS